MAALFGMISLITAAVAGPASVAAADGMPHLEFGVATVNLPVFDFPVGVRPSHVSHLLTRHTSTVMTQIGNRSSVGDR